MVTVITRRYVLFTDDEQEAFAEMMSRREAASLSPITYRGWDMARVSDMDNPPTTEKMFCVFQIKENK